MVDEFKELRSMILLELCCPPLPMMATRQETGESVLTNTHDVMSVFMITAFKRQCMQENSMRRVKQHAANEAYQNGLDGCKTFNQAYAHMSQFAKDYLSTYLIPGAGFTEEDIQILSPEHISPHLKEGIRDYCSAMRSLAELKSCDNLSDYSVDALLMDCVGTAIHYKQQGVVGVPVLVGVCEDISEEGDNPQALKHGVEIL
jgi:hypothetical protein